MKMQYENPVKESCGTKKKAKLRKQKVTPTPSDKGNEGRGKG